MHKRIHGTDSGKGSINPDFLDREAAIKRSKEFVTELLALNVNLRKAILFGSFATNEQKEWSDIDIALVADEFIGFGFEDKKYFAKLIIRKLYSMIQTKTYQTSYFEKGDPFIEEIIKTGIILYQS
jgi:uncharacterized protein